MSYCSIPNLVANLCRLDPATALRQDTATDKSQKFAEEASFYYGFFKNHNLKPVPDPGLMMVLQKAWLERKKRTIRKKENTNRIWPERRQRDEPPRQDHDELYD
ncbi:MAG: hypothetical protein ACPG5T_06950 [Endozoicomonas sp.]